MRGGHEVGEESSKIVALGEPQNHVIRGHGGFAARECVADSPGLAIL
jgi:hypothetical protein